MPSPVFARERFAQSDTAPGAVQVAGGIQGTKLQLGDELVSVDRTPVVQVQGIRELAQLLRGEPRSVVELELRRGWAQVPIRTQLQRRGARKEKPPLPPVAGARETDGKNSEIRDPSFRDLPAPPGALIVATTENTNVSRQKSDSPFSKRDHGMRESEFTDHEAHLPDDDIRQCLHIAIAQDLARREKRARFRLAVGTGSSSESTARNLDYETSASAGAGGKGVKQYLEPAQRKRRVRDEQNELLASLDKLLPGDARRGGFKGAGPRSAGGLGRSTFNILTDTIHHLRAQQAAFFYRDVLLSSKTLLVIEVEVQGDDLVVRTLGSGAQDWFADAPWEVSKGVLLRELVHQDSWSSLQRIKDTLSGATAKGSWLSSNNWKCRKMVLDVELSHFETSKYVCDHLDSTKPSALRSMNTVEYVRAKVKVMWSAQKAKMDTPPSAKPKPAANHPHAILFFDTPESWQWVPLKPMANNATGPSEPAGSDAGGLARQLEVRMWQQAQSLARGTRRAAVPRGPHGAA